ncbi:MAG TPA: hydrogenase 4 membrane subunit [Pyrodictium sp.]|nr:hydrogenase 4 membrane subunit [Pyrodictium sp.]
MMEAMHAVLLDPWQIGVLDTASMLILVTATVIALTRDMPLAVKTYIVQAVMLVVMFLAIGVKYEWFFGWSLSALVTKAILVPWVLFWAINRTRYVAEKEEPIVPLGAHVLIIAIIYASSLVLVRYIVSTAHMLARIGEVPLVSSLSLVALGLLIVTVARNALKQVMGIILFENGSHILLAATAFHVPETVEIGIATDAVIFITVLTLLAYKMVRIRGDMDISKLVSLKY